MANPIRPEDLPPVPSLGTNDAFIVDTGDGVYKTTPGEIVVAGDGVTVAALAANGGSALVGVPGGGSLTGSGGAGGVGFLQSGTGAVARTVQDKAREIVSVADFGAKGDGTTDDTAAIQKAIDTGADVFFPRSSAHYKISARLNYAAAGQVIRGEGALSKIVQTGTGDDATAFFTQYADCGLFDILVTPGTTVSDSLDGWAIYGTFADRLYVRGLRVKGMRRGGVAIKDTDYATITDNFFSGSVVANDGTVTQAQMGYDIYVYGDSSYGVISRNQCVSGCGAGIGIQNAELGKSIFGFTVTDNVVRNQPCYGIMLYLSSSGIGVPGDRVDHHVIADNVVTDISGSVYTDGVTLFYGAGIYIQGADNFVCANNQVLRTNTDTSLPRSGSDVPAAVAVSGFCQGTVTGNVIDTCHFGVAVINGSYELPDGDGTIIADNTIKNVRKHGVYLASANSATVSANRIIADAGNTDKGIYVVQGGELPMGPFQFVGNLISGFAIGIESNTVTGSTVGSILVQANKIRNFTTYGVYGKADEVDIQNNSIASAAGGGIVLTTAVTRGLVEGNVINTPAGNALEDASPSVTVGQNDFVAGALVGYPSALANGATPTLKGRRYVRNSNTTTITGFTDGQEGQQVVLTAEAAFTLQHGSALILNGAVDRAMTAGQAIQLVYAAPRWRQI